MYINYDGSDNVSNALDDTNIADKLIRYCGVVIRDEDIFKRVRTHNTIYEVAAFFEKLAKYRRNDVSVSFRVDYYPQHTDILVYLNIDSLYLSDDFKHGMVNNRLTNHYCVSYYVGFHYNGLCGNNIIEVLDLFHNHLNNGMLESKNEKLESEYSDIKACMAEIEKKIQSDKEEYNIIDDKNDE